jgi:NIMA (never in mitosis gene a)-related kinase
MDRFSVIRPVGSGAFGECVLVRDENGARFVIKKIDISSFSPSERETATKEARILQTLDHPNIIKCHGSFLDETTGHLCIVMDYADGGDLHGLLQGRGGALLSEEEVWSIFLQLALALKHVHDRRVLHRDLKTQNVLLTSGRVVKLADFGIAKVLAHSREMAHTAIGTPYYLSPEIVMEKAYSFKSDVWSLGCVLYELIAVGKHAFEANNLGALVLKIMRGVYDPLPRQYSPALRGLVGDMLVLDPRRRPDLGAILARPEVRGRVQSLFEATQREGHPPPVTALPPPRPMSSGAGVAGVAGVASGGGGVVGVAISPKLLASSGDAAARAAERRARAAEVAGWERARRERERASIEARRKVLAQREEEEKVRRRLAELKQREEERLEEEARMAELELSITPEGEDKEKLKSEIAAGRVEGELNRTAILRALDEAKKKKKPSGKGKGKGKGKAKAKSKEKEKEKEKEAVTKGMKSAAVKGKTAGVVGVGRKKWADAPVAAAPVCGVGIASGAGAPVAPAAPVPAPVGSRPSASASDLAHRRLKKEERSAEEERRRAELAEKQRLFEEARLKKKQEEERRQEEHRQRVALLKAQASKVQAPAREFLQNMRRQSHGQNLHQIAVDVHAPAVTKAELAAARAERARVREAERRELELLLAREQEKREKEVFEVMEGSGGDDEEEEEEEEDGDEDGDEEEGDGEDDEDEGAAGRMEEDEYLRLVEGFGDVILDQPETSGRPMVETREELMDRAEGLRLHVENVIGEARFLELYALLKSIDAEDPDVSADQDITNVLGEAFPKEEVTRILFLVEQVILIEEELQTRDKK